MKIFSESEAKAVICARERAAEYITLAEETVSKWFITDCEPGEYKHSCLLIVRQSINTSLVLLDALDRIDDFSANVLLRPIFLLYHNLFYLLLPRLDEERACHFCIFKLHGIIDALVLLNKILDDSAKRNSPNLTMLQDKACSEVETLRVQHSEFLKEHKLNKLSTEEMETKIYELYRSGRLRSEYFRSKEIKDDVEALAAPENGLCLTGDFAKTLLKTLSAPRGEESGHWHHIVSSYVHPSWASLHASLPDKSLQHVVPLRWAINYVHTSVLGTQARCFPEYHLPGDSLQILYDSAAKAIKTCVSNN